MKNTIIILIVSLCLYQSNLKSQTVFYNQAGLKVNKPEASFFRVYTLDKTQKKGSFKEFSLQNVLIKESGFLKFDFSDLSTEILNDKYTEYRNDTIYKVNYINNIPINQVEVYDRTNRLLQIIPIKNGKISFDDDVISYHYFKESKDNEYYTIQGRFEGDQFFGIVTTYFKPYIRTYFMEGENLSQINDGSCSCFTQYNYLDVNKDDVLSFEDNFNCNQNNNWVLFLLSKEIESELDFADIFDEQLFLRVDENGSATDFRLLNSTPSKIENNDFDIRVKLLAQNKSISGITINNKNYRTNQYTNQYRIGLSKDIGAIILEKMIDEIFVQEELIDVKELLKSNNELRVLKEGGNLKIILNNSLIFTDDNYSYVGESIGLYSYGDKGSYSYFDDFSFKIKILKNSSELIKLKKLGRLYTIPVNLNDVINTDFIIDTGASNVSITPDLALLLIKSGTIKKDDWLKDQFYQFADGSIAESKTFKIKKLKIGSKYLFDIECSISNNLDAPLLIGQNVLNKFGKVTIDNERQVLLLD